MVQRWHPAHMGIGCLVVVHGGFAGHDPKKAVKGVRVLDGGTLLSWSSDGTLRTWTLADATPQLIFSGHAGEVRQARVVGDGMLLSIGKDRTARLWDMHAGMQRDVVSVAEAPCCGRSNGVNALRKARWHR